MVSLAAIAALGLAGVSMLLAAVSFLAAARTRKFRFAFAGLAFLVLATRGALIVADGAGWLGSPIAWDGWTLGMDAVIVLALYAAVVKG